MQQKTANYLFLLIFIFIFSNFKTGIGQDFTFSQFEFAPLHLNPSYSGENNYRVLTSYKNLYDRNKNGLVSFDFKKPLKNNYLGYGAYAILDAEGPFGYRNNKYAINASYGYKISQTETSSSHLVLGAEIAIASLLVEQYTGIGDIINYSFLHWDIGSGVHWKYQNTSGIKLRVGYSIYHLNKPNIAFNPENYTELDPRMMFTGDFEFPIARKISLIPSFIFRKQDSSNTNVLRLAGKIYFEQSKIFNSLQVSVFRKKGLDFNNRGVGIGSILDLKNFNIGFSTTQNRILRGTNYEILFGYVFNKKQAPNIIE